MDDIWIISWFNHTAFDANPIWKSPTEATHPRGQSRRKPRGQGRLTWAKANPYGSNVSLNLWHYEPSLHVGLPVLIGGPTRGFI